MIDTLKLAVAAGKAAFRAEQRDRAQTTGSSLAGLFIGILIAGIIGVQVFIPVMTDAVSSSNASGTTKTILDLLPLFAGLLLLVALAGPLMGRVR